jgi:Uma2 family endonuclease
LKTKPMPVVTQLSQLDSQATYSYADYLTWQFDQMVELIRGRVFPMSPAPSMRHQAVALNVGTLLHQHFKRTQCRAFVAPFDVRLLDRAKSQRADRDIFTVVQPDLCVICDRAKLDERGCLGAPDWIIEILSPGRNAARDLMLKHDLYQENGVGEYWIVFPNDRLIQQFVLDPDGRYQLTKVWGGDDLAPAQPTSFPELSLPLEDVFAD